MALNMSERKVVTRKLAEKYIRSTRKEKGAILDHLIELSGYNRSYASRALRQRASPAKSVQLKSGKKHVTLVSDERTRRKPRQRPRKYDKDVLKALRKIWIICDCICGKRLAPFLPEIISVLERHEEIELAPEVREKLLQISAATIDRLLAPVKREYQLKARSNTKPGTLLKHQICPSPIIHPPLKILGLYS